MKFLLAVVVSVFGLASANAAEQVGDTQILKWKDGKRACFLLAFDDGAPTQLTNVVPELVKRKIVGTFYLVTGNTTYAAHKAKWEEATDSPYIVPANHTFTHKGIKSAAEIDAELAKNNEVLYALKPEEKLPRLLAFGKPGGVDWIIEKADFEAALKRHNLVDRPPFAGPPIHYKDAEATLAVVDQALAKGEMGHLDFHGVGGDWLATPKPWWLALLDKLEAERERLWITDAASWHKYVKERDATKAAVLQAGPERIRIALSNSLDGALYDEPLTLSTRVPPDWTKCSVTQGDAKSTVAVKDGLAVFSARPAHVEIVLEKAAE